MEFFDTKNYEFNTESKDGIYIIHGFTNTTYETRDLAKYLGEQGFHTKAINLPGHGTTPEDCNRVKFTDWIEFTEQGVAEMSSRCDNVYVIGISMGSVLALHLSSVFPLNASVYAATVLQFKDVISTRVLTPIIHKIIPFRDKRLSYSKNIRDTFNYFGYSVWPMSAVNEVRKLINKLKLNNQIKITGKLEKEEWRKLSTEYDIFLNTTNYDNHPVTILEAMALGIPIVTTNVGGIPNLLTHNNTAKLVDPNDVSAMSMCVLDYLSQKEDRIRISSNARDTIEKEFNKIKIIPQWLSMVDGIINFKAN